MKQLRKILLGVVCACLVFSSYASEPKKETKLPQIWAKIIENKNEKFPEWVVHLKGIISTNGTFYANGNAYKSIQICNTDCEKQFLQLVVNRDATNVWGVLVTVPADSKNPKQDAKFDWFNNPDAFMEKTLNDYVLNNSHWKKYN